MTKISTHDPNRHVSCVSVGRGQTTGRSATVTPARSALTTFTNMRERTPCARYARGKSLRDFLLDRHGTVRSMDRKGGIVRLVGGMVPTCSGIVAPTSGMCRFIRDLRRLWQDACANVRGDSHAK